MSGTHRKDGGPTVALSVRQPWAWLIVNGYKDIENRNWRTNFRGRVLVHAGSVMTRGDYSACMIFIAEMSGEWRVPAFNELADQCGGIVGEVEIVDCVTKSESPWFCGDYGYVLRNAMVLPFVKIKGRLGFFRV